MRWIWLPALFLGCVDPTAASIARVEGAEPFAVTAQLSAAWNEIESCSGLRRDFRTVNFYTATNIEYKDGYARGLFDPNTNRIYILATETLNTRLIEHEIMHAHLPKVSGHPPHYFSGVCGNLI